MGLIARQFLASTVGVHCKETETDDRMIKEFLLHKDKIEKGKASPQKQECGCPSLQPSLRSHTYAFFADPPTERLISKF